MTNLLIHSMSEFSDIILEALRIAEARTIVEIGAEYGGMSHLLADFAGDAGGSLVSIDPAPKEDFAQWAAAHPAARHVEKKSLEAFADLKDVDAWVIDGDHNWYTVYNELKKVEAACTRDGKPVLAFLHDVAWPCARRDSYYSPGDIPAPFRQSYDYNGGAVLGQKILVPNRGFRGCGQFAFAVQEGGPRNGVLTALEDFVAEAREGGSALAYAEVPGVFGLAVLFDTAAPWAEALAELVLPYHENKLLKTLEENRLRNYLTVLDWQDREAERQAA